MRLGLGLRLGGALGLSQTFKARFTGTGTQYTILAPITRQITAAMTGDGTQSTELLVTKRFAPNYTGDGTLVASLESAYDPSQDPDLFDWWNAQSGVTESSGELTAWVGSVNSETANPPTVTSRPLYGSDTINGLDVLTFRSSDPNYIKIDVSTVNVVTMYVIIKSATSSNGRYMLHDENNALNWLIADNNNTAKAAQNLGTPSYYIDGVLEGVDITRTQLDNAIVDNCLLTITNLDLTSVNNLLFFTRSTFSTGNALNCNIGDIIISEGTTFLTENNDYLISKYGF